MISPIADMFLRNILILIATICIISRPCLAELFTAVTDMEGMLDTETVLINNLESYVEAQEEQLNYLRRYIIHTTWMLHLHNLLCAQFLRRLFFFTLLTFFTFSRF